MIKKSSYQGLIVEKKAMEWTVKAKNLKPNN